MRNQSNLRDNAGESLFKLLLGVGLLLAGAWVAWRSHTVWDNWPSTDAQVVRASIVESSSYVATRGEGIVRQFRPSIELTYTLEGKPYVSHVLAGPATEDTEPLQTTLKATLAPGSHHTIRYNPNIPSEARWETFDFTALASSLFLMLAGSLFCAIGFGGLVKALVRSAHRAETLEGRGEGLKPAVSPEPFLSVTPGGEASVRCPSCGARIEAGEDSCPSCLKYLHAA